MIIALNPKVRAVSKFVLNDYIKCTFVRSSPDGKHFFKTSKDIRVLVLDWSLQDKHGSILKCLKEAKLRKNVLVVNVFTSDDQKKYVLNSIPNIYHNNKIYSVVSDFLELSLTMTLFKLKKRIYKKATSAETK